MFTLDKFGVWGKILLFFYLLIAANFIGNTFSCRIQDMLLYSVYVRHLTAIVTLYFVVLIIDKHFIKYSPFKMIFVCIAMYIYFLISVKSQLNYFIASIILLLIITFLQHTKQYLKHKKNKNKSETNVLNYIENVQLVLIVIMILVTLFGFFVYLGIKKEAYYKAFSLTTFILGKSKCKNNNIKKNIKGDLTYFVNGLKLFTKSFS